MEFNLVIDLNYKIEPKSNFLQQLSESEMNNLIEYLYSLNENVQWFDVIKKHLNTNNEKFIKHLKSLTWEDHNSINNNFDNGLELKGNSKCKNIYNRVSDLVFTLKLTEKNIIHIPVITDIKINFVLDYLNQIKHEYTTFFDTLNVEYELKETNDSKLLTDFYYINFPFSKSNSKILNELIYSIFVNINSDEFAFK